MEDEAAVIKTAAEKAEQEYFSTKEKPNGVDFSHKAVGPDGKHILASESSLLLDFRQNVTDTRFLGSVTPHRVRGWLERSLDWFLDGILQVE